MSSRALAERLAAIRAAPPSPPRPAWRPPAADRAAVLARWFGARLQMEGGATAVIVEREVRLEPEVAARLAALPGATYFDTETTGLSTGAGTVLFLAGMGWLDGQRLIIRQLLLPDYPHEPALLRRLSVELASQPRLVTYNGRAFDLPLLVSRLTVHGLFRELAELPQVHDDLLPVARRLFRRPLGSARLAEVEAGVLGVRRVGDCPGSEVPLRYFGYLQSGSPEGLAAVLDHNLQDVVSLALLEAHVVQLRTGGWRAADTLDRRGMALELVRHGALDEAVELVETAVAAREVADGVALKRVASRLLLTSGDVDRAEALWITGTRQASLDAASAWLEVARIRERHRGDLPGALQATSSASRVLDLAFALGRGGGMRAVGDVRLRVDRRMRRLRSWCAAAERRRAHLVAHAEDNASAV